MGRLSLLHTACSLSAVWVQISCLVWKSRTLWISQPLYNAIRQTTDHHIYALDFLDTPFSSLLGRALLRDRTSRIVIIPARCNALTAAFTIHARQLERSEGISRRASDWVGILMNVYTGERSGNRAWMVIRDPPIVLTTQENEDASGDGEHSHDYSQAIKG